MRHIFRSTLGRALTIGVAAVAAVGLVVATVTDGWSGLGNALPPLTLAVTLVWALFWRPAVLVDDGGVTLRNIVRTIELPWPAIHRIDTKWALTLYTAYGEFTAWAAPAPGRHGTRQFAQAEGRHLPESSYGPDRTIRPGDTPSSPSGSAALVIRRTWERLRDAGYLDDPKLERAQPRVTWHWPIVGVLAALTVLTVLVLS